MSELMENRALIGEISRLLRRAAAEGVRLGDELERLRGLGVCTGRAYYRTDTRRRALYANHAMGASCPLHGSAPRRGRIRAYIGTDEGKQTAALLHMVNAKAAGSVTREIDELQRGLRLAGVHLGSARDYLRDVCPRAPVGDG